MSETIISKDYARQLTATYDDKFKIATFEDIAILGEGKEFNTGRITLSIDDVKAMLAYLEGLEVGK